MALCTGCGTDNPERAKFCLECGAALAEAAESRSAGTRKLVTVLFADVVGSTSLGEQLDPETMRAALARYFSAARTVLERHGGTVVVPPFTLGGVGRGAYVTDPTGILVGLHMYDPDA